MHILTLQEHPLVTVFNTSPLDLSFFVREELTDAQPHEWDTTIYQNHKRNNILAKLVVIDEDTGMEIHPSKAGIVQDEFGLWYCIE
jgi:hypothetical protein